MNLTFTEMGIEDLVLTRAQFRYLWLRVVAIDQLRRTVRFRNRRGVRKLLRGSNV